MAKIEFPKLLKALLEESDLQGPIRSLADRAGEILADNKLPFFPDYTDHGTDHINAVLKSEVELIPKHVWEDSKKDSDPRLLCDADAAVIIGATLLHDIAMHLRPDGFLELVSMESRFHPLSWFKESHEGHSADGPWHGLWEDYQREARRFSDRQLSNIIGEESARVWKFDELPSDIGKWERNHCLIIGEFIRRHHARLAHEIAIYGFPGLPVGSGESQFPAMGKEEGHPLMRLADLIGLTARSHGTSLRVCKAYLEASPLYLGTPRPMGAAVLYPMALLRVADYLQIDRQRAPAVLLQLRNPQSPISIQEWKKHRAVQQIGPANDPRGKMVTVSTDLSLSLYLQLKDLLAGLQVEMDHATAVLDEAYGTMTQLGLNQLNLAIRRVYSNLQSPAFRDSLPYVPNRTGFTADPNLLTLLVEPLYGKKPGVGVRELMQNAVDAVCELEAWSKAHSLPLQSLELPEQDGDVLIEFIKRDNGTWFLRVRDRGIGMRSDTIQNYFLRAGASFRRSAEWAKEFLDEQGQPQVLRAGRFGVGAFAVFLLGESFKLWTRHAGADKSRGYTIEASDASQLIEIRRVDGLPVGTTIEVELSRESAESLKLDEKTYSNFSGPGKAIDWFCWDWPVVSKRIVRGKHPEYLEQEFTCPIRKSELPPQWSMIHPVGFDAVYWTFAKNAELSCNGLRVARPAGGLFNTGYGWPEEVQLRKPCVAVLDSAARFPLTTQRYELSQENLPFENELVRDVTLSFIAHALVCGPNSRKEALIHKLGHPLQWELWSEYGDNSKNESEIRSPFDKGRLRWCANAMGMVPADPWLFTLLGSATCHLYGVLRRGQWGDGEESLPAELLCGVVPDELAVLSWHGRLNTHGGTRDQRAGRMRDWPASILRSLAVDGVKCLGSGVAAHLLVSADKSFRFETEIVPHPQEIAPSNQKENPMFFLYTRIPSEDSSKLWFKAQVGTLNVTTSLEPTLKAWEDAIEVKRQGRSNRQRYTEFYDGPDVLFFAQVRSIGASSPETTIAQVWNECIGPRAIPFDPIARKALIQEAAKHPELKRHIAAWSKMTPKL